MRVIAGTAKGRRLIAPEGLDTRPVTSKIKEALFNIWQMEIAGADFLDLFAGSGSIGIEAMSRGAKRVVFVEKDWRAVNAIKQNLSTCKFQEGCRVYRDDVFRRIERLKEDGDMFDIIYLDPPFAIDNIFLPVLEALSSGEILACEGTLAIRARREKEMPDAIGALKKFKQKHYGLSSVHFYCHDMPA